MGRGIAQLFAVAGHETRLFDVNSQAVSAAIAFAASMIDRLVAKEKLDRAAGAAARARLKPASGLDDLAGCSIVIEAIVEQIEAKQQLFASLEPIVGDECLLASNTSSLLISAIASVCARPGRVAGLHFFNPVPLMKLAEVIPGQLTGESTTRALVALVEGAGHRAVVSADQPGFIVNHAGRALYTEGFRIVEEGVADFATVDGIVREGMGFPMGPFELLDLTGLDVSGKVMASIFEQFQFDPRYRPSALLAPRLAARLCGRKTGRGFYRYGEGAKIDPEESEPAATSGTIWLGDGLDHFRGLPGIALANKPDAQSDPTILIAPWGEDLTSAVLRLGLDPHRCLAVDPFTDPARRRTLMRCPATSDHHAAVARFALSSDGVAVSMIEDSAGFVAQRIVAMVVNTACEIVQRGIASPADVDDGVRLGLGYPAGPLTLGDRVGPRTVLAILGACYRLGGDPRYRPVAWLRRRAELDLPLAMA